MAIHDFRLFTAHPDAADRETGKTLPLRNSRFLEQGEGAAARPKKHKASVDRAFCSGGFVPDSDLPAPSWLTLQLGYSLAEVNRKIVVLAEHIQEIPG